MKIPKFRRFVVGLSIVMMFLLQAGISLAEMQDVEEMTDYGVKEGIFRMLGKPGTKVNLTVDRGGEVFDVDLVRNSGL